MFRIRTTTLSPYALTNLMLKAVRGGVSILEVGAIELGALSLLVKSRLETVRTDDERIRVGVLVFGEEKVMVYVGGDEISDLEQVSKSEIRLL